MSTLLIYDGISSIHIEKPITCLTCLPSFIFLFFRNMFSYRFIDLDIYNIAR